MFEITMVFKSRGSVCRGKNLSAWTHHVGASESHVVQHLVQAVELYPIKKVISSLLSLGQVVLVMVKENILFYLKHWMQNRAVLLR